MPFDLSEVASNLELHQDGVWTARTHSSVSYPEIGNESCFTVEEYSFWFRHRNDCILHAIRSFPPAGTFFDVGGGNGYVARALQEIGMDVVLIEPGPMGVRNAIKRGVRHVIRSTLQDAGFFAETLPAVGLFDVLEHIHDDRAFLTRINHLLVPSGRVYITVPVSRLLWSHEDENAGHCRRYTLQNLSRTLEECGYEVEFASYFFGFLLIPILLARVLPYRLGLKRKSGERGVSTLDHRPANRYVERALQMLTHRELSRIAAGNPPSSGASCLVVARKSGEARCAARR